MKYAIKFTDIEEARCWLNISPLFGDFSFVLVTKVNRTLFNSPKLAEAAQKDIGTGPTVIVEVGADDAEINEFLQKAIEFQTALKTATGNGTLNELSSQFSDGFTAINTMYDFVDELVALFPYPSKETK